MTYLSCRRFGILLILLLPTCDLVGETFKNPTFISTGTDPRALNAGDFDRDGKSDIVYWDSSSVVHILLADAPGTFQPGESISLPEGVGSYIAVADVNQDGRLDLVLGGGGPQGNVGALLGNGDGTFQPIVVSTFPASGTLFATIKYIGVVDVDGDGDLDLIAPDSQNRAIYILLGNNTGAFVLKSAPFNGSGPLQVFTGDFNGDGRMDFVVHGLFGADATVYLGNGDGTFLPGVRYTGPNNIVSMLLKDMDIDGHPDLVVSDFSNSIDILQGRSDGTFANASSGGTAGVDSLVAISDLNGDGILDIVGAVEVGLSVSLGVGQLAYAAPVSYVSSPNPSIFAASDFNQDGTLDFAVASVGGIVLFLTNANGALLSADTHDVVLGPISDVTVADFNGDNIPDIAGVSGPSTGVLLGIGDGTFQRAPGLVLTPITGNSATKVRAGDFDGDGNYDVFVGGAGGNSGAVLFGNGNGTFTSPVSPPPPVVGFDEFVLADLNHDGRADAAITDYNALDIVFGQSDRTLSGGATNLPAAPTVAPGLGDFNRDGNLDLVTNVGTGMQILLGNGDGTFRIGRLFSTQLLGQDGLNIPFCFAVADFDSDGNIDVVSPMSSPLVAEIFYGRGDGTFDGPFILPLGRNYNQALVADVNRDGRPDLLMSDSTVIAVIHNQGNRAFGPEIRYLAGPVGGFTVQDLNGDGFPDIVVANGGLPNSNATTVTVLLNENNGNTVIGLLSVTPEPSIYSDSFTVTLSVTPFQVSTGTPTGSVTFKVDGTFVNTVLLQAGTASCVVTSSPGAGTHTIAASYSGDATFQPSEFTSQHKVVPFVYTTTTTLSVAPNPALASRTVTLTATVTSPGPVPHSNVGSISSVVFRDGTKNLGVQFLNNDAQAIFDTSLLTAGTHSLTASFLQMNDFFGNLTFLPSTSAPVTEVVTANTTATSLDVLPNPAQVGSAVTLLATVSSQAGTPTGATTFYDGNTALQTQPLDASGSAAFSARFSGAGTHRITAVYAANETFASSTSAASDLVIGDSNQVIPTIMSLKSDSGTHGSSSVVLTAEVAAESGIPAGEVFFFMDRDRVGQAMLDSSGTLTYMLPASSPGMHYVSAYYAGSSVFGASTASAIVNATSSSDPDFVLTLSSASATVAPGRTATIRLNVNPVRGFNQDVALSCFAGPVNLSCGFQPDLVPGGNGSSILTLFSLQAQNPTRTGELDLRGPGRHVNSALFVCLFLMSLVTISCCRRLCPTAYLAVLALVLGCSTLPVERSAAPTVQTVTVVAAPQSSNSAVKHAVQVRVSLASN